MSVLGIAARFHLGMAYHERGDYCRAADRLMENVIALGDDMAQDRFGLAAPPAVLSRLYLAWCLAEQGEFQEAINELTRPDTLLSTQPVVLTLCMPYVVELSSTYGRVI